MNVRTVTKGSYRHYRHYSSLFGRHHFNRTAVPSCQCAAFGPSSLTSKTDLSAAKWQKQARQRPLSTDSGPPSNKLPPLMDFPKITWPSMWNWMKNSLQYLLIIRPYLDNDFDLEEFTVGAKKAVEVVSKKISAGDVKSLEGLVTSDIVPTIQRAISLMSLSQREQLAVEMDDIYFAFPYQVGVMFNDENSQKRFVEITMVFHALRGLGVMRSHGEEPPINMGMMPEYQSRISVCNYRFIREFTKGVESDWTINLLNHFKPVDELQE